jgi:hypothetical protein
MVKIGSKLAEVVGIGRVLNTGLRFAFGPFIGVLHQIIGSATTPTEKVSTPNQHGRDSEKVATVSSQVPHLV